MQLAGSAPAMKRSAARPLFVLAAALTACGGGAAPEPDPQALYEAAVEDAKVLSASKISRNLTAITADNAALEWEGGVPGSRVLVATWLGNTSACSGYQDPTASGCKPGSECPAYGFNSWVTVVPELRSLLGRGPTLLRVAQALGLPPPTAGQTLDSTCIIELYVRPCDLFRPSADPEVTDHEAELSFPLDGFRDFDASRQVYSEMPCDAAHCTACTASGKCGMTTYRDWYENRRTYVYGQTPVNGPYPWTALGYTYDWESTTANHFGLSEFVINAGASGVPVFIRSVTWTGAYFRE